MARATGAHAGAAVVADDDDVRDLQVLDGKLDRRQRSGPSARRGWRRWRCTNTSPGSSPVISLAGTRLSAQPIHMYLGLCCCARRVKKPPGAPAAAAAQARLCCGTARRGRRSSHIVSAEQLAANEHAADLASGGPDLASAGAALSRVPLRGTGSLCRIGPVLAHHIVSAKSCCRSASAGSPKSWPRFAPGRRRPGRRFHVRCADMSLCRIGPVLAHHIVSAKSSLPISIRRISEVPAPISYSLASRQRRPSGYFVDVAVAAEDLDALAGHPRRLLGADEDQAGAVLAHLAHVLGAEPVEVLADRVAGCASPAAGVYMSASLP